MVSLDVHSLFTNMPLQEAITICVDKLFEESETVEGLSKDDFRDLLTLSTNQSYFKFDKKLYRQLDGVAKGSPLGPCLSSISLSSRKQMA